MKNIFNDVVMISLAFALVACTAKFGAKLMASNPTQKALERAYYLGCVRFIKGTSKMTVKQIDECEAESKLLCTKAPCDGN